MPDGSSASRTHEPGLPRLGPGVVKVAPSILSADFGALGDEIAKVAPVTDWLHVDVMDGHFVPNVTIGPPVVESVRPHTGMFLDCHLMMTDPGEYLEAFAAAGADACSVHVEVGGTAELAGELRRLGLGAGLVCNPETPFAAVEPYLDLFDLLLVMTVHPGFGGQAFIAEALPKVTEAARVARERGLDLTIQVDGGIGTRTAPQAAAAGARCFVAGSAVFHATDPAAAVRAIEAAAAGALGGAGDLAADGRAASAVGLGASPDR